MPGAPGSSARRRSPRGTTAHPWRPLRTVLARRAATTRTPGAVRRGTVRSLVLTLLAAVLAAPFATIWGIGHAHVTDYLGPHRVEFATTYRGEVRVDLGPLGNAYLPSPYGPVGLDIEIGGVGAATTGDSLLAPETLAAYTALYVDPAEAVAGVVDRLVVDAVLEAAQAELVLLAGFGIWMLRRRLLSPALVRHLHVRRVVLAYAFVLVLIAGSVLGPAASTDRPRVPVTAAKGSAFTGLTVDSRLLADLLDRGVRGVRLLAGRQQRAVAAYVSQAAASLNQQGSVLPEPAAGETMIFGYSDLHCNRATTALLARLVDDTDPALVISSGDDTVNGTAAERGCIRREARMAQGRPHLAATGNHDSDITESQMRDAAMTVLDGSPVPSAGLLVLGDDDPEQNIPFSIERVRNREETEQQLGERMVNVAGGAGPTRSGRERGVDVLALHQPAAAAPVMQAENPPARLVIWGHYHTQGGPTVLTHADGSWTVGMQQGTAGGVREPTILSFSTPFSPPLIRADGYFYFRDDATGLITAVQPVHFTPDARFVVDPRIPTGDLEALPPETREQLGDSPTPTPAR